MRNALVGMLVAVTAGAAVAQPERYEVGRRLKAFETDWEATADPAARRRAAAILPAATGQFFTFKLGEVGRTLDRARFALRSDADPSAARQWVNGLSAVPESRLIDGNKKELTVTVSPFASGSGPPPKGLELHLWFDNTHTITVSPDKFPTTVTVPIPPVGEFRGLDRRLYVAAEAGKLSATWTVLVSQAADLPARTAALKATADKWDALDTVERATVRDRAELLTALAGGASMETDYPAATLLENAEEMAGGKAFFGPDRPGRFWLSVPLGGKKTAPLRVSVPKGLKPGSPVPLVVALHGAGGSENLYFEGYGAGQIVKECEKRGWLLAATRAGGLGFATVPPVTAVVDELAKRYPVDPKRVFLVGHSMGAAHAVELLQRHPGRFAAAAALGGGWSARSPEAVGETPLFLGVGEEDAIARKGARALHKALADAGAKNVTFREYPGLEHLLIVREALPDAFAVFDGVVNK